MKLPSIRLTYLLGFITILTVLSLGAYLQAYEGISPCPLCILQRITFAILGIVFFVGMTAYLQTILHIITSLFAAALSMIGALLAGRQAWLQHLPPNQNGDCGASLEYMLRAFPLNEVFHRVVKGGTECSLVEWKLLGLSLADWSLICFAGLFILSIMQLLRCFRKSSVR